MLEHGLKTDPIAPGAQRTTDAEAARQPPLPFNGRVRLAQALVRRARLNGSVALCGGLVTIGFLWEKLPPLFSLSWFGVLSVLWIGLGLQISKRIRKSMNERQAEVILRNSWKWALANGLVWGALAFTLPWLDPSQRTFVEVVCGGMCAGAAAMLSPAPNAARAYIASIAAPFIGVLLWMPDRAHNLLALMAIIFVPVMIYINRAGYKLLDESIQAQRAADLAMQELEAAQDEWRELSEATEAFALFDQQKRLLLWNDAYARILGLAPRFLVRGKPWRDIADASGIDGLPEARFFSGDPCMADVPSHREEHAIGSRWYRSIVHRLPNGHVAVSHVDISTLKNREAELLALQQELEHARDAAEAASQAKSRFLANMSHELRTPLNAVIGFSDLMVQDLTSAHRDPAMHEQYARTVLESGQHLLSIVEDMLDLARIEAGKLRLVESRANLVDVVHGAGVMARGRDPANGAQLIEELPDQPVLAKVDARLLRQALINLIGNALKFSRADGRVFVRMAETETGDIRIEVEDEGIGIAPDMIGEILKPFTQVENSEVRRYGGIGLGLPLAKQFVELQGGRLELESELDRGTRATVLLPAWRRIQPDPAMANAV